MPEAQQLQIPAGIVVMTTHGSVRQESVQSWSDCRSFCDKQGAHNIQWMMMPGALPEKTRNEAVRTLLRTQGADWLLQIDADMTWAPDAVIRILQTAYGELPHSDVVGAYCCLRGELALPTCDTGSGTWESWMPGSGTIEVIRTGAAFHLVKRRVYEGLSDPWYRLRVPARPVDFMQEVDGFARQKFDGRNPFRELPDREWERLEQCALEDPSISEFIPGEVGEDSSFMDRCRNANFKIYVNTDIVTGHVDTKITDWRQHKEAMEKMEKQQRQVAGCTT